MDHVPNFDEINQNPSLLTTEAKGAFIHRRIAEQLRDAGFPVWKTENEMKVFLGETVENRATELLNKLASYNAAAAALVAATPPPPPAPGPAGVPDPAPPQTSKRAPKTTSIAGGAPISAGVPAAGPGSAEILAAVQTLAAAVMKQNDIIEALQKSVGINFSSLNDIKVNVMAVMSVQQVQLGLLTLFGQQVLGAGMDDFMGSAMEDANKALTLIEKLGKG